MKEQTRIKKHSIKTEEVLKNQPNNTEKLYIYDFLTSSVVENSSQE